MMILLRRPRYTACGEERNAETPTDPAWTPKPCSADTLQPASETTRTLLVRHPPHGLQCRSYSARLRSAGVERSGTRSFMESVQTRRVPFVRLTPWALSCTAKAFVFTPRGAAAAAHTAGQQRVICSRRDTALVLFGPGASAPDRSRAVPASATS